MKANLMRLADAIIAFERIEIGYPKDVHEMAVTFSSSALMAVAVALS